MAAWGCLAGFAQADVRVDRVADVLRSEGYSGAISSDGDAVLIAAESADFGFSIAFQGCVRAADPAAAECATMLFSAGFETPEPVSLERLDRWNARKLFGRAYADGDLAVRLDHAVAAGGGLSDATIADNVAWFETAASEFRIWLSTGTGA